MEYLDPRGNPTFDDPAPDEDDLFLPESEVVGLAWTPSEDQVEALRVLVGVLLDPGVYSLSGAAGCGKTSIARVLLARLTPRWNVTLCAPTWRAAARLSELTGRPAQSLHSLIYGKPVDQRRCGACQKFTASLVEPVELPFWAKGEDDLISAADDAPAPSTEHVRVVLVRHRCDGCGVIYEQSAMIRLQQRLSFDQPRRTERDRSRPRLVVVDEASMLSQKHARDMRTALLDGSTRVLLLGDRNQLSPVLSAEERAEEIPGCGPLDSPTAMLSKIHRQVGDNPILPCAHRYKTFPDVGDADDYAPARSFSSAVASVRVDLPSTLERAADWAIDLRVRREDAVLVTWTNKDRAKLNRLVRERSGWLAWSVQQGLAIQPGERLLARSNSGCVYNGEVWTVAGCRKVPPGEGLLGADCRVQGHPENRGDLLTGIGVYRVRLVREYGDVRDHEVVLVLPLGTADARPMLESDMILAGEEPGQAKDRAREISGAWQREYERGLEKFKPEYETACAAAERKVTHLAIFREAVRAGNADLAARALEVVVASVKASRQPEAKAAAKRLLTQVSDQDLAAFQDPEDAALNCASVIDYCRKVHGALDPGAVAVFDWGECLTGHAMQGSQARHVGVVFSYYFGKGFWERDRIEAMRWVYTAYTRAAEHLVVFDLRYRR